MKRLKHSFKKLSHLTSPKKKKKIKQGFTSSRCDFPRSWFCLLVLLFSESRSSFLTTKANARLISEENARDIPEKKNRGYQIIWF